MRTVGVVLPYWLDRPDGEAIDVAVEADRFGYPTLWIGEMVTFEAFALATAIGLRTRDIALKVGPLAAGVRSPVALALSLSSVAQLTGRRVDLALGAANPLIVHDWHGQLWAGPAPRMRETVRAVRSILKGERANFAGEHVHARGFRLRHPLPDSTVSVAAFGPRMTKVAAEEADEVVLNITTPGMVRRCRETVDAHARAAGVPPPRIAVWLVVALNPSQAAIQQVTSQLAVYLKAKGYAEMFTELGYGELVHQAVAGASHTTLAHGVPAELLARIAAIGTADQIAERIAKYHEAGADHVGLVPCTADDPGGRAVLGALAPLAREITE